MTTLAGYMRTAWTANPDFTKKHFFIDRFHLRGHVGCSSGYCLDSYKSMDICGINSQVNEQANSGLQRIKGQLAYMKQNNFVFTLSLFLYIVNKDKIRALDVSYLSLIHSCFFFFYNTIMFYAAELPFTIVTWPLHRGRKHWNSEGAYQHADKLRCSPCATLWPSKRVWTQKILRF